jgi:hypothetical protein
MLVSLLFIQFWIKSGMLVCNTSCVHCHCLLNISIVLQQKREQSRVYSKCAVWLKMHMTHEISNVFFFFCYFILILLLFSQNIYNVLVHKWYIHSIALDQALASLTGFLIVRYIQCGVISPMINLRLATWYDHQGHLLAKPADTT